MRVSLGRFGERREVQKAQVVLVVTRKPTNNKKDRFRNKGRIRKPIRKLLAIAGRSNVRYFVGVPFCKISKGNCHVKVSPWQN